MHRGASDYREARMLDRVPLVKLREFIDRIVWEKNMYSCALWANYSQHSHLCVCVYALTSNVSSIINTQSYGRLNAGLPPVPGPIIICGIVRAGPISKTAAGRDLCRSQSTKSFRRVIISALPLLAVRFPVVRAISMRLVHLADELPEARH